MRTANSEEWRDIAEAITQEADGEKLTRLVNELCVALDRTEDIQKDPGTGLELKNK
jgi:hypothetical protein